MKTIERNINKWIATAVAIGVVSGIVTLVTGWEFVFATYILLLVLSGLGLVWLIGCFECTEETVEGEEKEIKTSYNNVVSNQNTSLDKWSKVKGSWYVRS